MVKMKNVSLIYKRNIKYKRISYIREIPKNVSECIQLFNLTEKVLGVVIKNAHKILKQSCYNFKGKNEKKETELHYK